MKRKKVMNFRTIGIIAAVFILLIISELLYAFNNKWVLCSYILNTSKFINNNLGSTQTAFYLSTEFKYKMPQNIEFMNDVNDYFHSLPEYFNLPSYLYFFGLSAYEHGLVDLTPHLFNLAIKIDPDFSFWRVELANYYLVVGNSIAAEKAIADCVELQYPRNHCEDFMGRYHNTNIIYNVGFLKLEIMDYYNTHRP